MLKKKKFLIGGAIVLAAIALLSVRAFAGSSVYYYEVGDLLKKGASLTGDTVKVRGVVENNSVQRQTEGSAISFTLSSSDGASKLPVTYKGVVPDTFTEGGELVCQGKLGQDGVFRADQLMPKCPSKYTPAPSS